MKRPSPRVFASLAIGALAVVVLVIGVPRPRAAEPFARGSAAPQAPAAAAPVVTAAVTSDTLHAGETLAALLSRGGVRAGQLAAIFRAVPAFDARRAPAGMAVRVRTAAGDSAPSEITFRLAVDRLLHVHRTSDSTWAGSEEVLPWRSDTILVHGTIRANLYQAIDDSASAQLPPGARDELAWTLADLYEYRVDMSRELHPGDTYRALVERRTAPDSTVRIGTVLAAQFTLLGKPVDALRFTAAGTGVGYFDQTGRSLRASFLRAPLSFRRISSVFGRRWHPILNMWRQHKGTDYAAAAGTPVRAIGAGTIIFAGWKGGYGNVIDIRHRNGMVSRYGHLRGFAAGIRSGRQVDMGQTIGYVGMTGLATGPHLHFEVLVHGVQRDPSVALDRRGGRPLPASERERFDSARAVLLARLGLDTTTQVALR